MKRRTFLTAASIGAAAALTGCVQAKSGGGTSDPAAPANLKFATYAFQDQTVKAIEGIVAAWNQANPTKPVELQKVDPNSVHDKLVTQFAGGAAPDIVHDENADIAGFSRQGFLTDLTGLVPPALKASIPQSSWDACTFDGKITGVPTIAQLYVVFANTKLLTEAGIAVPKSGQGWSWDELAANSKKLTAGDRSGFAWGLKSATAGVLSVSMNYDGKYFTGNEAKPEIAIGANELKVPQVLRQMLTQDKSMAPNSISLSGADVLPGFLGGKYAMFMGGNYMASQVQKKAPQGFEWTMLPPLHGTSNHQAANPQTLSISRQSKFPNQAMEFIAFFCQAKNIAEFAIGDGLIPVSPDAAEQVRTKLGSTNGWDGVLSASDALVAAPMTKADKYSQWKSESGNPAFQEYFSNKIDDAALTKRLTEGWQKANS